MSGWKPHRKTLAVIEAARRILAGYGHRPTLRRVFYELVSADLIPNTERAYKNLSYQLDRARWAGLIDPDAFDDLQRQPDVLPAWDGPGDFVRSVVPQYRSDWWRGAPLRVELWAEKAAVTGILAPVAREYGIPFLAMRGFGSFTAVHDAVERAQWYEADGTEAVDVLYVGDFDPSGMAMDEDLTDRLARMGGLHAFERVALTRAQVDDFDLIPQPVKRRDSRAADWQHGGSWELDAVPVGQLIGLIRKAVEDRLPDDFEDRKAADRTVRAELRERWES